MYLKVEAKKLNKKRIKIRKGVKKAPKFDRQDNEISSAVVSSSFKENRKGTGRMNKTHNLIHLMIDTILFHPLLCTKPLICISALSKLQEAAEISAVRYTIMTGIVDQIKVFFIDKYINLLKNIIH